MEKKQDVFQKMDRRELDFPETKYVRDIDSRVFQAIIVQCLSKIEGVSLLEGNLFDDLLGRDSIERVKGLYIEQDLKKHSIYIRVEVNVLYGVNIPQKAEEIQTKLVEEISALTGLHVSCVHVLFKNLLTETSPKKSFLERFSPIQTEEFSSRF